MRRLRLTMVSEDPGGVAFCCSHAVTHGVRLAVFVAVDPESSVVPASLWVIWHCSGCGSGEGPGAKLDAALRVNVCHSLDGV